MPKSPPDPLPGTPLTPLQVAKLDSAKSQATAKLRFYRVPDLYPPTFVPTTCTELFENSPLGKSGIDLLLNYAVFRNGEGVTATNGSTPCDRSGVSAWTTCCSHSPVIYICDEFASRSVSVATTTIIHELLHVAGQLEDGTSGAGPGNPPTSSQINDAVNAACASPTPVY